ncbi:MAG: hypothetical protein ACOC2K_00185 [Bacteroidota bacterium]
MKFLLLILFIVISFYEAGSQTRVVIQNGEEYIGYILSKNDENIEMQTQSDVNIKIYKKDIVEIENLYSWFNLTNGDKFYGHIIESQADHYIVRTKGGVEIKVFKDEIFYFDPQKENYKPEHPVAGFTASTPGLFNLVLGYNFSGIGGLRAQGGYLNDDRYSIQGDFLFELYENKDWQHNLSISFGFYRFNKREPAYLGFNYDLNYRGIFGQVGWAHDLKGLETGFIFQIGYLYRFNHP